jgi:hypothetical protein
MDQVDFIKFRPKSLIFFSVHSKKRLPKDPEYFSKLHSSRFSEYKLVGSGGGDQVYVIGVHK